MMDITGKIIFGIIFRGSGRRGGRGRGPWTNNPNNGGQSSTQNSQ